MVRLRRARWQQATIDFSDEIQQEDIRICETVQRGLRSRHYDRGRFSVKRENGVHHFHGLLAEFLPLRHRASIERSAGSDTAQREAVTTQHCPVGGARRHGHIDLYSPPHELRGQPRENHLRHGLPPIKNRGCLWLAVRSFCLRA